MDFHRFVLFYCSKVLNFRIDVFFQKLDIIDLRFINCQFIGPTKGGPLTSMTSSCYAVIVLAKK